jgi:hypothetical protein
MASSNILNHKFKHEDSPFLKKYNLAAKIFNRSFNLYPIGNLLITNKTTIEAINITIGV